MNQFFAAGGQSIGVSASTSVLPMNVQDWLDLLAVQGTLKSLLQHCSSALIRQTLVGKVMSLLFNMLSSLVVAFLPRSKCLLISWLPSPSVVILEPRKIKSDTVSTVSPSISQSQTSWNVKSSGP